MWLRSWPDTQVLSKDYKGRQISPGNDFLSVRSQGFNEVGGYPPDLSISTTLHPIHGSVVCFRGWGKGRRKNFSRLPFEIAFLDDKAADRFFGLDGRR